MGIFSKKTNKNDAVEKTSKSDVPIVLSKKNVKSDTTKVKTVSSLYNNVIISTHVTEKAMDGESQGTYIFVIKPNATKIDVKMAINQKYGIMPKRVRVIWTEGKKTRFGKKEGRKSSMKKAIVTLPKGQSISIHHGV